MPTSSHTVLAEPYRRYLLSEGKRYDRASSRIDNIEALVGRERDANAIDIAVYREVLPRLRSWSHRRAGTTAPRCSR
jgi:hypothetical protein